MDVPENNFVISLYQNFHSNKKQNLQSLPRKTVTIPAFSHYELDFYLQYGLKALQNHHIVNILDSIAFQNSKIDINLKERWQIEIFFKALKQNLKIKTFVGTTMNAIQIQIWTALIAMLLIKYFQFRARRNWSLSNLVALLRWNLMSYRNLWQWLDDPFNTPPDNSKDQLTLIPFPDWDSISEYNKKKGGNNQ